MTPQARRDRPADRLPPRGRGRRRRHDDGRVLRRVRGRSGRAGRDRGATTRRLPGLRRFADAMHAEGAAVVGAARSRRPRRGRHRAQGPGAVARLQLRWRCSSPAPSTTRDIARITGDFAARRGASSTPASTPSSSTSATATCVERVPQPEAQPAHGRLGRRVENRARFARQVATCGARGGRRSDRGAREAQHGRRRARRALARRERRGRAPARGRRRARRARAHRRQLVREPDVPVPRRGADRRDGGDVPAAAAARASSSSASGSSPTYPFEEAYFLPYARQFRAALDDAAGPARWHQPARHRRSARWPRASSSSRWAGRCCASPTWSTRWQKGDVARGALHPLQQVHADDLPGHALRARRA